MGDYIIVKGDTEDRYIFLNQITSIKVARGEGGEKVTVFFADGSAFELTATERPQFLEQFREKLSHRMPS